MTVISIVAAMANNRVIGLNNALPWKIPAELQHFKQVTMGKPIIMGRKTFDAIGRRLLPGRQTIVLTRDLHLNGDGYIVVNSIEAALLAAGDVPEIMVIGGASIYQEFLPLASRLYLSIIPQDILGDAFFPAFDERQWYMVHEKNYDQFIARIFERL